MTHWYMATKNPAPAPSTNSAFGIGIPVGRPLRGSRALDLGRIVAIRQPSAAMINRPLPEGDHVTSTMLRTGRATRKGLAKLYQASSELVASIRIVCGKGEGTCHGVGGDVLGTMLGAAMIANMSNGPMHEYRGSWTTRASG